MNFSLDCDVLINVHVNSYLNLCIGSVVVSVNDVRGWSHFYADHRCQDANYRALDLTRLRFPRFTFW